MTRVPTKEAARVLGISRQHVALLIRQGRLRAIKLGRDWYVLPSDLAKLERNPRGNPNFGVKNPYFAWGRRRRRNRNVP